MTRRGHCRYTVIDEESGQALGTVRSAGGASSVDFPMLLAELPHLAAYEPCIVRVEWDDYDEVRVTVRSRG